MGDFNGDGVTDLAFGSSAGGSATDVERDLYIVMKQRARARWTWQGPTWPTPTTSARSRQAYTSVTQFIRGAGARRGASGRARTPSSSRSPRPRPSASSPRPLVGDLDMEPGKLYPGAERVRPGFLQHLRRADGHRRPTGRGHLFHPDRQERERQHELPPGHPVPPADLGSRRASRD